MPRQLTKRLYLVKARVNFHEKKAVAAYMKKHTVTESEVLRRLIQAGLIKCLLNI